VGRFSAYHPLNPTESSRQNARSIPEIALKSVNGVAIRGGKNLFPHRDRHNSVAVQ